MKRIVRSLLAGALFGGILVVGGGVQVAQAACADGSVSFSGTVSNGGNNTTVHLLAGNAMTESGWLDFNLATVDWANLYSMALEMGMIDEEQAAAVTSLMESQNFTDTTSSGAYEICVSEQAIVAIENLMSFFMGGGDQGGGDQGGGDQGGGSVTAPTHIRPLVLEGLGYQVVAIPSLTSWTPGESAPSLGATPTEVLTSADCEVSCMFDAFSMATPTIWGQDSTGAATDVYVNFYGQGGGGALAAIPVSVVGGGSGASKFAASFQFMPDSMYSIMGGSFSETTFARVITATPEGTAGYVTNGNIAGSILDPNGVEITQGASAYAELYATGSHSNEFTDFWSDDSGNYFGNVDEGQTYRIVAEAYGYSNGECFVTNIDGELSIAVEPASTGCTSINDDGTIDISVGDATAAFVVIDGAGNPVGGSSVGVGLSMYGWFSEEWFQTGDEGVVSWSPSQSGYYRIGISGPKDDLADDDPLYQYALNYVHVVIDELSGEVSIDEVCESWDYSGQMSGPIGCAGPGLTRNSDDRFEFALEEFDPSESNDVKVLVTNSGDPVHRSRVRVEQLNTNGWFQYLFEIDTDNRGLTSFELPNGRYKFTANPSWDDTTGMAADEFEFCMTVDGPTDCAGNAISQEVEIALASPNVVGTVWKDEIGGEAARWVWGGVETFNPTYNYWQWIKSLNADSDGVFRISLDPATRPYRLNIEPPWGDQSLSKAVVYVLVEADGVCSVANENATSCGGEFDTSLDVVYPTPNFTGTVTAAGEGTRAFVQGDVWNGQWWQWAGLHAQTNISGEFALNLAANPVGDDEGTFYRIAANPQDWGAGYSRVEEIIEMRDLDGGVLQWCQTNTNAFGIPIACDEDDFAAVGQEIEIALRGANFKGLVTNSLDGDAPLQWIGVQVVQPSDWGGWTWLNSANTNGAGVFQVSIELPSPGVGEWSEIQVQVNPPWNSSFTLVKKDVSYWVGDIDGDGTASDICRIDPGPDDDCDGADLVSAAVEEPFPMSGGNLNGTITDPSTGEPAPNIQINVEEKVEQDWDGDGDVDQSWYAWVPVWGQSNSSGVYSVQVDDNMDHWGDTIEGTFRVTARPWGRTDVAEKSVEFCLVAGEVDQDCDGVASGDEEVDITLASPNVTGEIQTAAGVAVPNAWIAVEELYTYDWDGAGPAPAWEWWNFTGRSAQSNVDGEFSIFVDPTVDPKTYRLAINPPWNWSGDALVRFNSPQFTFTTGGTEEANFYGPDVLQFPAPKIELTVVDQDGDPVPQSWLNVESLNEQDWNTDGTIDWTWWQWENSYGSTNFDGDVALNPDNLDVAGDDLTKWRVVVNPPWNGGSELPRFEVLLSELTVVGGTIVDEVAYPAANFMGTVYVEGDGGDSTDDVVSPWGWISIESFTMFDPDGVADNGDEYPTNFQWVAGGNTNQEGDFSLRVSDGDGAEDTYLVRFYAGGGGWKPPVEALVTFDASDELVSWVYRADLDDEQCVGASCVVDVFFDHVPPNLDISISLPAASILDGYLSLSITGDGVEIPLTADGADSTSLSTLITVDGTYSIKVVWVDSSDEVTCDVFSGLTLSSGVNAPLMLVLGEGDGC